MQPCTREDDDDDDDAVALDEYRAAFSSDTPAFWSAGSVGFRIATSPPAIGLAYARLWQGMFDVTQSWNGVPLTIDVDIATTAPPSSP